MTAQEQKSIDRVFTLVSEMREENRKFREDIAGQVNAVTDKVEKKHLPIQLESDVVSAINNSLAKAMNEALTGYNSPLTKYAQNVVAKYQPQIESLFDDVVKEGIQTEDFKQRVREVLLNKIAKTMISGVDGSIDKTINLMKQDAIFRSRLTLSVNTLVDEFLNKKNNQ